MVDGLRVRRCARHCSQEGTVQASVVLISFLVCAALFLLFPSLDLWVSAGFYRADGAFFWHSYPVAVWVYDAVPWVVVSLVIGLTATLLASLLPMGARLRSQRRKIGYLLLVLLLGPGYLVNVVLKDHWGRARPDQVQPFGGTHVFTPALIPTNQCNHNCSFVSGHASLGFYWVAFGFLSKRYRRHWMGAGLVAGSLIGMVRIVQGGHFLSDVVFSFFAVYFVAWFLHFWIQRQRTTQ